MRGGRLLLFVELITALLAVNVRHARFIVSLGPAFMCFITLSIGGFGGGGLP
ncbi:MAG: hypothetical protein PVG71_02520 [Anaerolineae bacterium]|jgi:hypothetical protein